MTQYTRLSAALLNVLSNPVGSVPLSDPDVDILLVAVALLVLADEFVLFCVLELAMPELGLLLQDAKGIQRLAKKAVQMIVMDLLFMIAPVFKASNAISFLSNTATYHSYHKILLGLPGF